jgi:hypothetical protein
MRLDLPALLLLAALAALVTGIPEAARKAAADVRMAQAMRD